VQRDAEGHVHLTLHRDPESGRPRLALEAPIFEASWQNEMVAATANTALGTLREQPTVARSVELARDAMAVTSQLSDDFVRRAPAGAVACKAGCDHCCHQVVSVTPPEALAIADHLRKNRSTAELARVGERVAEAHARGLGLSTTERYSLEHPCPFLEAGQCSIYEVRPLSCRGMNSRDAAGCLNSFRDASARDEFLLNARGGYSFAEPIRAFLAISVGLQLGLSEVYKLDMQPLELTAAMHLLLSGSESLPREWIAGQMPFASARTADETQDAKLREVGGMYPRENATPR
jgi:Fe-S-cluster containining protein